jgi:hypothetical protein
MKSLFEKGVQRYVIEKFCFTVKEEIIGIAIFPHYHLKNFAPIQNESKFASK